MGGGLKESSIGIKIADGTFFPVLEDGYEGRKKVVLTTVRDDQTAVQIDLYRGQGGTLEDAEYVGSLIIENITPSSKGEPEIEVVLGMDAQGNLEATASDRVTGEQQTLSVSMESLGPDRTYDIPEFSFEKDEPLTSIPPGAGDFGFEAETFEPDLGSEEAIGSEAGGEDDGFRAADFRVDGDRSPGGREPGAEVATGGRDGLEDEELIAGEAWPADRQERKRRLEPRGRRGRRPLLLVLLIVLALLLIAGVAFLVYRGLEGQPVPELQAGGAAPAPPQAAEAAPPAPATDADPPPAAAAAAPAAAEPVPAVPVMAAAQPAVTPPAPQAGVWYRIKWGDTLWDLSGTYYRNPWLYRKIAKANRIKNPDLIFAETRLFIPEM